MRVSALAVSLIHLAGQRLRSGAPRLMLWRPMASDLITYTRDATFEQDVLKSDKLVLVDFWATWCGPCRAIAPNLEKLAAKHPGVKVVKLDVDHNQQTAAKFQVTGIPLLLVFKDGKQVGKMVGNPGRYQPIEDLVKPHL